MTPRLFVWRHMNRGVAIFNEGTFLSHFSVDGSLSVKISYPYILELRIFIYDKQKLFYTVSLFEKPNVY